MRTKREQNGTRTHEHPRASHDKHTKKEPTTPKTKYDAIPASKSQTHTLHNHRTHKSQMKTDAEPPHTSHTRSQHLTTLSVFLILILLISHTHLTTCLQQTLTRTLMRTCILLEHTIAHVENTHENQTPPSDHASSPVRWVSRSGNLRTQGKRLTTYPHPAHIQRP